VGAAAANYANPLGRASMQRPNADRLARASVVTVSPLKFRLLMTPTSFEWDGMPRTSELMMVEQLGCGMMHCPCIPNFCRPHCSLHSCVVQCLCARTQSVAIACISRLCCSCECCGTASKLIQAHAHFLQRRSRRTPRLACAAYQPSLITTCLGSYKATCLHWLSPQPRPTPTP